MKSILFTLKEIDNLEKQLQRDFLKLSVYTSKQAYSQPSFVTLWDSRQQGLRIRSSMYDVAERMEVGVLCFEMAKKPHSKEVFYSLPKSFSKGTKLQKFVIEESGYVLESGLRIEAGNGDNIVIVPNAMPFSLAIHCTGIELNGFEPEYDLEEYELKELR